MLFNQQVTVKYPTKFNDFDEVTDEFEGVIKCNVLRHNKLNRITEGGKRKQHDLVILVKRKDYMPYEDLFSREELRVIFDSKTYEPASITPSYRHSGDAKYYQIALNQVQADGS